MKSDTQPRQVPKGKTLCEVFAKESKHEVNKSRALNILRRRGPMRASALGWELWGDTTECAMRGTGSHRNNKFARAAGKVLKSLEAEGRAGVKCDGFGILWFATRY